MTRLWFCHAIAECDMKSLLVYNKFAANLIAQECNLHDMFASNWTYVDVTLLQSCHAELAASLQCFWYAKLNFLLVCNGFAANLIWQECNLHNKFAANWVYGDFGFCVNLLQFCYKLQSCYGELAASLQAYKPRLLQIEFAIWDMCLNFFFHSWHFKILFWFLNAFYLLYNLLCFNCLLHDVSSTI